MWHRLMSTTATWLEMSTSMASCVRRTGNTDSLRQVSFGVISRSTGFLGYLLQGAAFIHAQLLPWLW